MDERFLVTLGPLVRTFARRSLPSVLSSFAAGQRMSSFLVLSRVERVPLSDLLRSTKRVFLEIRREMHANDVYIPINNAFCSIKHTQITTSRVDRSDRDASRAYAARMYV